MIGYSDITIPAPGSLATIPACRVPRAFTPVGTAPIYEGDAADRLRRALMKPEPITIRQDRLELTAKVVVEGAATGILMGGNLNMLGRSVGWTCPSFAGSILLIEAVDTLIGQIDGTLTQLRRSGCLDGLKGVAVGQFIRSAEPQGREMVRHRCALRPTGRTWCADSRWAANWAWSAPAYRATWNDGNAGHNGWHSYD